MGAVSIVDAGGPEGRRAAGNDAREKIDIVKLNAEIEKIVAHEQVLRDEIEKIIAEIEVDR